MLDNLNMLQHNTIEINEDKSAARAMGNDSRPKRQTRHVYIKHFPLLDWISTDQLIPSTISTHNNPVDRLTKFIGPQLFAHYCVTLIGKREQTYFS